MSTDTGGRTRNRAIIIVGLIFAAIIVVSVGLALSTPVSLPTQSTSQATQGPPYVLVIVYALSSTTYTVTTVPSPHVYVVVEPMVIVVLSGTQTYTVTTTSTTTSTSWG